MQRMPRPLCSKPIPWLLALALAAAALQAQAQQTGPAQQKESMPSYESLDADGDGIVTLPEIVVKAPQLARRVQHCDSDGDKKLSRSEYAACEPTPATTRAHG